MSTTRLACCLNSLKNNDLKIDENMDCMTTMWMVGFLCLKILLPGRPNGDDLSAQWNWAGEV
ncbi:hypothetical protein D3C71_2095350 [compost metagenome]